MFDGDRVMIWDTQSGRRIDNSFLLLPSCAINSAAVARPSPITDAPEHAPEIPTRR